MKRRKRNRKRRRSNRIGALKKGGRERIEANKESIDVVV